MLNLQKREDAYLSQDGSFTEIEDYQKERDTSCFSLRSSFVVQVAIYLR